MKDKYESVSNVSYYVTAKYLVTMPYIDFYFQCFRQNSISRKTVPIYCKIFCWKSMILSKSQSYLLFNLNNIKFAYKFYLIVVNKSISMVFISLFSSHKIHPI